MASTDRARQKKLERHKKKRLAAGISRGRPLTSLTPGQLVVRATANPISRAWISGSYLSEDGTPPLVTAAVARRVGGNLILAASALVDRTCLGVKNAMLMAPATLEETRLRMAELAQRGDTLIECSPAIAQSVVFHAIDYAERLGFTPHRDFDPAMFGPRPEPLLEIPFSNEAKPYYFAGPRDDSARILARLDAAVGPEGYDFTVVES